MATEFRTVLKEPLFRDSLRRLLESKYDVVTYAALLSLNRPARINDILTETRKVDSEKKGVPLSRLYSALSRLEKRGLTRKSSVYPRLYSALIDKAKLDAIVNEKADVYKRSLERSLQDVWEKGLQYAREQSGGMWQIGSEGEATDITKNMWQRATKEILVMTESGVWMRKLAEVLREKGKTRGLDILVLIGRGANLEVEGLLSHVGAHVYHYTPRFFRLDVVDRSEGLLLMCPPRNNGYIYYSREKNVAEYLAWLFKQECLRSDEAQSEEMQQIMASLKDL